MKQTEPGLFGQNHNNSSRDYSQGGGQNLLSPERRFDAVIVNSPDLFEV